MLYVDADLTNVEVQGAPDRQAAHAQTQEGAATDLGEKDQDEQDT